MALKNSADLEERNLVAKKVYDPFLRFLHWWNALSIFSLMLTIWLKDFIKPFDNGKEILYRYHIFIGYALTAGILLRVIWGFVGPEHAKFKNMIQIKPFINLIKTRKFDNTDTWGHDKYASLLYIFVYILMLYEFFSGLYLAAKLFEMGPFTKYITFSKEITDLSHLIKEIHEVVFYISMGYLVLHVFMLIFHEVKDKYPLTQAMFSGFQYRKKK